MLTVNIDRYHTTNRTLTATFLQNLHEKGHRISKVITEPFYIYINGMT